MYAIPTVVNETRSVIDIRSMNETRPVNYVRSMNETRLVHDVRSMNETRPVNYVRSMNETRLVHDVRSMNETRPVNDVRSMNETRPVNDVSSMNTISCIIYDMLIYKMYMNVYSVTGGVEDRQYPINTFSERTFYFNGQVFELHMVSLSSKLLYIVTKLII